MPLDWRPMRPADLAGVVGVAAISFPDHFESLACFENRLALNPSGNFVLAQTDGAVRGYLVAYPWRSGTIPALNVVVPALPADADTLYLHDLALHPDVRGQGHSRTIVERLVARARRDGWTSVSLVAVNDAARFWEGHGFTVRDTPALRAKLVSYGADARAMSRSL
jgi:N-acetylglutamate synthase-like GNAT family acetyltransferase